MRKIVYAVISCLVLSGSNYAMDFGIGIKGGISIHELNLKFAPIGSPSTRYTYDFRIGPTLSVFGEIINNNLFGQQIGFGYFQSGGSLIGVETDELGREIGKGHNIIKLDYLFASYSVKCKYDLGFLTPYILLGAQYDYLINYDDIYISSKDVTSIMHNFTYSELNKSNLTPVLGIGLSHKIFNNMVFVEYLPYFHLLPFYEHSATSNAYGAKHTTFGHVINIGIKFKM